MRSAHFTQSTPSLTIPLLPYLTPYDSCCQLSSMLMYSNKRFHMASGSPLKEDYFLSDSLFFDVIKVGNLILVHGSILVLP